MNTRKKVYTLSTVTSGGRKTKKQFDSMLDAKEYVLSKAFEGRENDDSFAERHDMMLEGIDLDNGWTDEEGNTYIVEETEEVDENVRILYIDRDGTCLLVSYLSEIDLTDEIMERLEDTEHNYKTLEKAVASVMKALGLDWEELDFKRIELD